VGAKGGFVLRRSGASPAETRALADAQYRVFIESLLDLTDGVDADGRVRPPPRVVRWDGDDPYLVVAADKGTAHLSDAANAIAKGRDFWLGDAFASGGSEGYDHKRYGITARGAWACVKHHFAELGIDPERDAYTVAGIGDMSGDVFGNGLLLMRRAKLVAAFDHRHVFVDPDPDPEVSYEERRRLASLAASSWDDYDRSKLSTGGGVFPRAARRVPLSPEARQRLGVSASALTGNDLVRAILGLDVDLLWHGGIGTYVKASWEGHGDAGDRTNDAVRVDARALRARVVAEGGNLGLTQAARVEAARAGVHMDTDAIHNSGGVDLSDHEVNFKVLLAPLVRSGALDPEARHAALFAVADEACERVVAHNRSQALAISLDELRSRSDPEAFLEAAGLFCRATGVGAAELGLPDADIVARRREAGSGLLRPELAVLLGLAKLATRQAFAASPLADDPSFEPLCAAYFPERLRGAHPEALAGHFLRREITALVLANRLVDAGGATLVPSLAAELGVDFPRAAAAVFTAEEVLQVTLHRERLLAKAASMPRQLLYSTLVALDEGVRALARSLVWSGWDAPAPERIAELRHGLAFLREGLARFLSPSEATLVDERRDALEAEGLPPALASDLALLPLADRGLHIVGIAARTRVPPMDAAAAYARLGDGSGLNWLYQRLAQTPPSGSWDRLAQVALHGELLDLQRELTELVLASQPADPVAAADAFLDARAELLAGIRELQRRAVGGAGFQALLVIAQRLRGLRAQPGIGGELG
jgi:glutamate dehydrogenase